MVGSWIAYAVGYFGRVDILEKHGRKLHIKPSHLAWADRWFERYGDATVFFFSRMLPIIRTFISLPAGAARMPFAVHGADHARLHPLDLQATFIGKQVGDQWEEWRTSSTTWTTRSPR